MTWRCVVLALATCSILAAEPAVSPEPAVGSGGAGTANTRPLRLGLAVAEEAGLDGSVVVVRTVEAASTAAALGLQADDRLLTLAGQPVTTLASLAEITRTLQVGATVSATVERAGERLTLNTTAIETPRPAQLAQRTRDLDAAVTALAADAASSRDLRLEEILILLKQVQEELPKAAAAFKAQYPEGRFHIAINIDIRSDAKAVDPQPVE